jgi:hypothetical protein
LNPHFSYLELCLARCFTAGIVVVGSLQLAIVAHYRRWLYQDEGPVPAGRLPVSVIVPCKGQPEHIAYFDRNIESLLDQDYDGPREYVFVCPSSEDPAYLKLRALLEGRRDVRWQLLDSRADPRLCSEKCANLLFGAARADPASKAFVFADCDMRFSRDWLRRLAGPLVDPAVAAATAPAIDLPFSDGFAQFLYIATVNAVVAADALRPGVWGYSFAITRERFESLGIAEIWSRSLTDDVSLRGRPELFGGALHCARAFPVCWQDGTFSSFFARHRKNFGYLRAEAPAQWLAAGLWTFGKLYWWRWFGDRGLFAPLALMAALDAAAGAWLWSLRFERLSPRLGDLHPRWRRWGTAASAACAVLAPFALAGPYLAAALSRRVRWGGRVYLARGRGDVVAEPGLH